jgi:peptidoglycan-N-acetylglucosamine deacetylase
MHPHVIGHRSRIAVLEELIDHISTYPNVWYATHADIAEYVKRSASAPPGRSQKV